MAEILVGIPTYKSDMNIGLLFPLLNATRKKHKLMFGNTDTSATCYSFNQLWCNALDLAEQGKATHFLMVHSDIVPENWFVDKMVAIMERCGADVLSAIVPIKSGEGLTSTAMEEQMADEDPRWRVRRITMREAHAMPKTWTHDLVLLNTGLMLVDLRGEWTKKMHFHFDDEIVMYRGKRRPQCFPEDWNFSRDAKKLGAKLYATREVGLTHMGHQGFPNYNPWGTLETDFKNPPEDPFIDPIVEAAVKVDGYMSQAELTWLARTAKESKVVVELGSWKGRSTKAIAAALPEGGVVFAVDNWHGNSGDDETGVEAREKTPAAIRAQFEKNLAAEISAGKVVVLDMDHASVGALLRERLPVGCEGADLIFIDGDHQEASVRRDIQAMLPYLKDSGILAGHDFQPMEFGVTKAVGELLPDAVISADTIWAWRREVPSTMTESPIQPVGPGPITSSALEARSTVDQG